MQIGKKLFGFDVRLTGLDSGYLYLDSVDALAYVSAELTQEQMDGIKAFMDNISAYTKRHPDIDALVYVVGGYQNPAMSLYYAIDPARGFDKVMSLFEDTKSDSANLYLLGSSYDSLEDCYHDFFRIDHLWNACGMCKAYGEITNALDMPIVDYTGVMNFDEYAFSGSLARASLYELRETPFDLDFDYRQLRYLDSDGNMDGVLDPGEYWDGIDSDILYDFYDGYYGNLCKGRIVGGEGERSLCFLSNSYGVGIERLLSLSSKEVTFWGDLHPENLIEGVTLESRVQSSDSDTVIFIASPVDYVTLGSTYPEYFEP